MRAAGLEPNLLTWTALLSAEANAGADAACLAQTQLMLTDAVNIERHTSQDMDFVAVFVTANARIVRPSAARLAHRV